ncbi:peptide chain release factor N(5)-glutamine methyltransferase [Lachnospiraceae bacterium C1.1]|nr:peptide chain release factor N(5)-glutamine methyltransferase [Lachnospiraceae bacterium C1.1]
MNYTEAYLYGKNKLEEAGITDIDADCRLLLDYATGRTLTFILAHGEEEMPEQEEERFREVIEKRAGRYPLQLITGKTDFMGLEFEVSEDVLIPRIDTEFLVEEAMAEVEDGASVLDLCTGSGCVLLSLMKYKNNIKGIGTDISEKALELAGRNAWKLGIGAEFIKSDLFENVSGEFDYILSNPPYIKKNVIDGLMDEVRLYEPHNALDGGEDGLDFYRIIAAEGKKYLTREGKVFVEIGYDQGEEVKKIFEDEGYINVDVVRDFAGNERVVKCSKNWKTP